MIHTPLDSSLTTVKAQTRAEKRRLEKEQAKSKAVYTMTREQLEARDKLIEQEISKCYEKQMQEIKTSMLSTAISCIESSLCIVLSDELGFGKTRIQRIIDRLEEQLDCIISGNVTLDDLEKEKERLLKENKHYVVHRK
ncbi:MAG: hypothetical protein E7211_20470 [Clostridium lundense]|nr:hypothetical protein [Clostridium lundense]